MSKAKPYLLAFSYTVSCIIFCISALKIAGAGYLEAWEAVGMISGVIAGFMARSVYDYIRRD